MASPPFVLAQGSGLCLVAAGALMAGAVAHPDVFDTGFAAAALQPFWTAWHAAWLVSTVLSLFGLAGLYACHAGGLGVVGLVGVVLAVPGLVLVACAAYVEAFLMPALARAEPRLLDWHGPLLTSPALRIAGGLALAWLVGIALVGVATWRANILPRRASATLTVGALAFGAFEGPFVPVLGVVSVLVFAAGHVWLGLAMWSSLTTGNVGSTIGVNSGGLEGS